MPFPSVQRVQYAKNPLEEVICQFRFPPILKIDTELPAEFQDAIREAYPEYSETSELKFEMPSGVPDQIPAEMLRQAIQSSATKSYQFLTEEKDWKVNLTRTFIALTTTKYQRWEQFKERLIGPFKALLSTYSPSNFARIGLRYINVIRRSKLGLDDVPWAELLTEYIAGIIGSAEIAPRIQGSESSSEIMLSDEQSIVRIVTKFVTAKNDKEVCFMIDSDFYRAVKTPIDRALDHLDFLNGKASGLIRWAIKDKLYQAMEPSPL
ncbi:MAG: TIGR04255 family protein [Planctomycetes bacterium]|nr:TIGR04255 family protein [Planctomycetota bacterium]